MFEFFISCCNIKFYIKSNKLFQFFMTIIKSDETNKIVFDDYSH